MPRTTIDFMDDAIIFETDIPILVNHLNYGNHLGNDSVLAIMQEARMRWLKSLDMSEIAIDGNIGHLIVEVILQYKAQGFHDDLLTVQLYPANIQKRSFDLYYKLINKKTKQTVAVATTAQVFFDIKAQKVAKTPQRFLDKVTPSTLTENALS